MERVAQLVRSRGAQATALALTFALMLAASVAARHEFAWARPATSRIADAHAHDAEP